MGEIMSCAVEIGRQPVRTIGKSKVGSEVAQQNKLDISVKSGVIFCGLTKGTLSDWFAMISISFSVALRK